MHPTSPIKSYRCLTPASECLALRAVSRAPCRFLLANRGTLTGTSQPNARGTLLPPSPPEPQRGHTRTRKSLASQLASTAELPLKITAELHPTPHKKIRQTTIRQRNVTLTDHPPSSFLSLSFIAKMRLTYFLN
jgi:hypothetical protein